MKDLKAAFTELLGAIGLAAVIVCYFTLVWALVCFKFWYWFLLPVFPMVPHIAYAQAIGIMLFLGLFKNHHARKSEKDDTDWVSAVVFPWLMLLIGYLFYCAIY